MIAYNNEWLYNLEVQQQAGDALRRRCIAPEEYEAICQNKEVKFYTPNFFVRIGLALLTWLITGMACGLMLLMFGSSGSREIGLGIILCLVGCGCYIGAEVMAGSKAHYNSGVDNMLVWMAAVFTSSGIWILLEWGSTSDYIAVSSGNATIEIKISLAIFMICSALAVRFADTLMSIAATCALLAFAFFSCRHMGARAQAITPFILMLVSGIIYFIGVRALAMPGLLLYRSCLRCVSIVGLIALYASGNYYLVRELGNDMLHLGLAPQAPMPMGWFFWLWTFGLPVVYIIFAIRKKDIILIRTGIPLIAAAIFTFRYYHSLLSRELAMMGGGLVLFIVSYTLINYLRTPRHGFTFAPDLPANDDPDISKLLTGEAINKAAGH